MEDRAIVGVDRDGFGKIICIVQGDETLLAVAEVAKYMKMNKFFNHRIEIKSVAMKKIDWRQYDGL